MPVDPSQLAQDKDFLSAPPDDQIKYLASQDPDFAKASRADQLGYITHITGKAPAPNAGLAPPAGAPSITSAIKPLADQEQGTVGRNLTSFATQIANTPASVYHLAKRTIIPGQEFNEAEQQRQAQEKDTQGLGVLDTIKQAAKDAGKPINPIVSDENGVDWGATAANLAPVAAGLGWEGLKRLGREPLADLTSQKYSNTGDHISSALRSNTKVDVPAEAKIAAPAIEEGLNDRGITTNSFKGRNGPAALQAGIDNALDIHEARAKYAIDPIRGEEVDPKVLQDNPELANRFRDKDGNLPKRITYGDLDAERIKLNKELRTGNFYSKPPSAQYAVQDPLASVHQAADQARNLVYDKVAQTTGLNVAPLKRTESALIKLGDLAETTKNTLSPKEAQFNTTPLHKKILGTVQGITSVKANPINAFSIPEKPGLFNPLNEFNGHMREAFPNLKAATADRTIALPRYNLNLTSPGDMPAPLQRILNLQGGENIPGEELKLTHPEGKTPELSQPKLFDNLEGQFGERLNPHQLPESELNLSPSSDMPPMLQRVLGFENPGVPSELYPGVKKK